MENREQHLFTNFPVCQGTTVLCHTPNIYLASLNGHQRSEGISVFQFFYTLILIRQ